MKWSKWRSPQLWVHDWLKPNRCYLQSAIYNNVLNGNEDSSLWNVGRPCMPETSGCNMLQRRSIPYILVIIFEKVWEGIEKVHLLDLSFKVTDAWSMIPPMIITYLMATCFYYQPKKRFNVIISYMIGWFLCCNFCYHPLLLWFYCGYMNIIRPFRNEIRKIPMSKRKSQEDGIDPSLKLTISPSEKEDPPERQHLGGGNSNTFLIFTRIPGEMIQFVEHIFQMGWNHQLEHDVHPLPMISVKWVSCSFFVWCFLYPVSLIEDIIPI